MNGKKILVVDDEKYMLKLIHYNLSRYGYEIVTASNGQEALCKVYAERPDLILLDIKMPGMNGYEICKLLRKELSTRHIPIIFISVMDDGEIALALGANSYIPKPFSSTILLKEVQGVLKESTNTNF